MSQVRLVVREAGHDWSGTIHGASADRVVAALSADPMTLAELETACARFERPRPNHKFLVILRAGLCDEPYDAGFVIIDLVARLVVIDSTYSSPGLSGEVNYHDGECATGTWLRYHLASDWLFASDHSQWSGLAALRRRERAALPQRDFRAVFYGRPLIEFIARETFAAHSRRKSIGTAAQDPIKDIHAAWLLTSRDDLGGACPRDVALERRSHLTWDLQDQAERWSQINQCPPGLDESSFAYRHGGFGTHELVLYYEMVRMLLWTCWDRLDDLRKTREAVNEPDLFTTGDFLTSEVPRLEHVRDHWLDTPNLEYHMRTPRSIIDRERARLPEGVSGRDAIHDADCPCCQMMADMPGPMFWHLDGCNMDDDFAFDIHHRTREEWEAEQRKWEEHHKRYEAEREERKRLEITDSCLTGNAENSVWSSSFSVGDTNDVPLGVRLFGIGCHLAELIVDLRSAANDSAASADTQQFIDQLNRDFGNLRELLQNSEASLTAALIDPVIDRFAKSLCEVASSRPDLVTKCESMTMTLGHLLDATSAEPIEDVDGSDLPF